MARGELIRKLFLSHKSGSEDDFRAIALEIIAEEQKKNNNQLAKELLRILENQSHIVSFPKSINNLGSLPKDRERQTLLVDVRNPSRYFSDILLSDDNFIIIKRIIDEFRKSDLLRTHGLAPKSKILFCGPPGCGKTLCSDVISCELGLPMLYTRFDSIVSSYLGETAANLRKVFDYARTGRWVVFFDEFDAIGKSRDDLNEHGELKRVINSFLQLLDNFHESSLLIAATNHEHLLDQALWRRFDEILFFPRPTISEIKALIALKLKNFPYSGFNIEALAAQLKGMSHADIERICFDSIKSCILEDKDAVDISIFNDSLKRQKDRIKINRDAYKKKKM